MAEYVITLPNPVPTITDDLAYDHGNIVVAFTVQQMVQTLELSTVARANTALNKGRNAWVIVNLYNVEIYRYRYDVATRKITIISPQPLDGDLEVYILGKESDWNGTDPLDVTITKNVIGNVVTLKRTSKIGPSTDAVVRPPWPNATFDSVDVDMFFEFGLDLPVWTLRPNWREGITERLDWLTDVLSSTSGAEQRRMVRLSPRRSFEITINPTHRERSYADLFLHRMGAQEIFFPLWHDVGKLNAEAEIGSNFVSFDNTYREFVTGGYAILYKDAFTWELVEITDQDDEGITTLNPLQATWPNRATIYPVRPARLTDDSNFSALTGRVGESQLLFTLSRENDYDDEAEFDFTYAGAPVLTTPPNRRDALDQSFQRLLASMDNDTGRQRVVDIAGRSFTTQIYNWLVNGREAHHKMRQLLYWLRGRQRMLWVPTFNDDVRLARTSNAASQLLDIEKIGYGYTGGAVAGRDRVLLKGATGYEIARVTATGAALDADEERLVLATGLTQQMTAGTYGSFVDAARLDQDSIEITHHTDSDGTCEVSCAFRTFSNTRDPSGVISHPIPFALELPNLCGLDGGIFNVDANSFTSTLQNSGGVILFANPSHYLVVTKPNVEDSQGLLIWDAFSLWPMDVGSPLPPPVEGQTWDNRFRVYGSNGGGETLLYDSRTNPVAPMSSNLYTTPAAAFAAVQAHLPLIRTGYSRYRITSVADSNLGDNRGGLSLIAYITPTP